MGYWLDEPFPDDISGVRGMTKITTHAVTGLISKTVLDLLQVYLDPKWHTAIVDSLHVALLNAGTDTLLAG